MSIETYQFNLPITPGAIPPVLHLSQYDSGRTFTAVLRDDQGVPFELDASSTAVIKGRNAAGIAWQQNCTVSGANVTFTPSGAATDQFGVMPVTIEITESEEIISPLCVVFHIQKAGYTNEEAVLSPDFETAIEAAVAQAISEGGLGFSDEFKEALLACFNAVAWDEGVDGQALIDDLEAALYPEGHLVSITAAYDQDHVIYNTDSLDKIKEGDDLIVTAYYSDGTSEDLADSAYTLSGTLAAPSSVITVIYQGKTATITVVVSNDTTAQIAKEGKILAYYSSAIHEVSVTNGGITIQYELDEATTTLFPAGILATSGTSVFAKYGNNVACLAVYTADGTYVNYVQTGKDGAMRWTQDVGGTMTEYSQTWTVSSYKKIAFTVDTRYLSKSYMYDKTTGKIFFAGSETPYYGMSNISEAGG